MHILIGYDSAQGSTPEVAQRIGSVIEVEDMSVDVVLVKDVVLRVAKLAKELTWNLDGGVSDVRNLVRTAQYPLLKVPAPGQGV
jgi:hypothetical protein